MKVNHLLMDTRKLPGDIYQHLEFMRKQQEAGPVGFFCLAGCFLIILAVAIQSCNLAGVR